MAGDKSISLGHPSYVWGFGQERRLDLIRRYVPLQGRSILDVGCGLGMYVQAFRRFSRDVHGVDVDEEKVEEAGRSLPNIRRAPAEDLPFQSGTFDVVLMHEVIEHVSDDRQAICEAVRVLRVPEGAAPEAQAPAGGQLVIFAPNRLYPFETHGAFWRGRYHAGNIPLVNYLPQRCRDRFCPHVRAYTRCDLRRLLEALPVRVQVHTQVYPGYDKLVHRHDTLGRGLRALTYFLEHTPLRLFGLSHFLVAERLSGPVSQA